MTSNLTELDTDSQNPYQVDSKKEILLLLKSLMEHGQLVNMVINDGTEVLVSAILHVDVDSNNLILDCVASEEANASLAAAPRVYFEASLNRISIQFSTTAISRTTYLGKASLVCAIPTSLIRLQRREYYRISTPVTSPIVCILPVPQENGGGTVKLPLIDLSCVGVSLLDEKRILNADFGTLYENSQIDLPGAGLINVKLQVRNSQNLLLMNHKTTRRIGFQFIDLGPAVMAQIQKVIIKIERERNSRQSGMM